MCGCMPIVMIKVATLPGETMALDGARLEVSMRLSTEGINWGTSSGGTTARPWNEPMPKSDAALTTEFEPARREAWLTLVAKVLKGAHFDKRLVSTTRDGLAIQPLYTRADAEALARAAAVGRSGWYPGGWDVRQRHLEPDPEAANRAILEDLEGGATSVALQILAPGQGGLS